MLSYLVVQFLGDGTGIVKPKRSFFVWPYCDNIKLIETKAFGMVY